MLRSIATKVVANAVATLVVVPGFAGLAIGMVALVVAEKAIKARYG